MNTQEYFDDMTMDKVSDLSFPFFVNAYLLKRFDGGTEEGGWSYDWYELLDSKEVNSEVEAQKAFSELVRQNELLNDHRPLHSVISEGKVLVAMEQTKGEIESKEVPQYE